MIQKKSLRISLTFITCFAISLLSAQTVWNLKQCVDTALVRNVSVQLTKTQNEMLSYDATIASKQQLPEISFLATESFNHYMFSSAFSDNIQDAINGSYGINGSMVVYNGGLLKKKIEQSRLNYEAGNSNLETLKKNICLNVVYAYLQVLYQYEQLETARDLLEKVKAQYSNSELMVSYGKMSQANLSAIKAQVASQQFAVTKAENDLQSSKLDLMLLMEVPINNSFEIEKPLIPDTSFIQQNISQTSSEIYAVAQKNQPEIQLADKNIQVAALNVAMAKTAYLPTLSINGNIGSQHANMLKPINGWSYSVADQLKDKLSTSIGLSLHVPIFNKGITQLTINKAYISLKASELDKRNVENKLRKEIEQSYSDLAVASRNYTAALEYSKAAKESFANAEIRFNNGLSTSLDVLTERNNLLSATSQLLQAKYQYYFKYKVLDFYLGKSL